MSLSRTCIQSMNQNLLRSAANRESRKGNARDGIKDHKLRRRFFSSLIQRAAKLHKRLGGGSLTLLPVLAGAPARGDGPRPAAVAQYKHVSEAQRAKLQAALEAARGEQLRSQQDGCVRTEVPPLCPFMFFLLLKHTMTISTSIITSAQLTGTVPRMFLPDPCHLKGVVHLICVANS